MPNGNPYATYKQAAVETATPEKLLLMLYNGAIKFLHLAEKALDEKDYSASNQWLIKVQDIILELMNTLDMERGGEIAANLYQLYDFYLQETIQANLKKDAKRLTSVLEFFELFRETWLEAAKSARLGAR